MVERVFQHPARFTLKGGRVGYLNLTEPPGHPIGKTNRMEGKVVKLKSVIGRYARARRPWRSRAMWLGLMVLASFVIAACGGGNGDTEPTSAPAAAAQPTSAPATAAQPTSPPATDTGTAIRSPDAAPDFQITLFGNENHPVGEVLHLADLVGQPVVLNFWFPSCPPCRAEMPDFEEAFQKYKDQGVQIIGIQAVGLDSIEDGQEFVNEIGVTYALGPDEDSSITRAYKVRGFPTTIFLSKDQEIVREWEGFLNSAILDMLIPLLLN